MPRRHLQSCRACKWGDERRRTFSLPSLGEEYCAEEYTTRDVDATEKCAIDSGTRNVNPSGSFGLAEDRRRSLPRRRARRWKLIPTGIHAFLRINSQRARNNDVFPLVDGGVRMNRNRVASSAGVDFIYLPRSRAGRPLRVNTCTRMEKPLGKTQAAGDNERRYL